MTWRPLVALALLLLLPAAVAAVPAARPPRPPADVPAEPSYVRRVAPAIVGLHVTADAEAASSARLGSRRFATAVVFDRRGYAVSVSYALTDAVAIEAQLRDGATVPATLVGLDLESGLGVVRLDGAGPWPTATLGQSRDAAAGMLTGTVGVDEENSLVWVPGHVQSIRRFSSFWEYMLERAIFVAPGSPSWGGSAVVDASGAVIGIASLRLGEAPHVNLAIPVERFVPVKDELIAAGRVVSRRPRPWLGLYTEARPDGVFVDGFAALGPAALAGFRRGDRIVGVNGVAVRTQEEFYEALWRGQAGDVVAVAVQRGGETHVVRVVSMDRYRLLRRAAR